MLNIVAVMGRLVADPEMRQTGTGKSVASFRIACDRGRKGANGQSQTDFLDVVAWERTADFVCKYFQKRSLIIVDGKLQSRRYQDKNGNDRTAIEIVANNINFAGSKNNDGDGRQQAAQPFKSAQTVTSQVQNGTESEGFALLDDSEDLPFDVG